MQLAIPGVQPPQGRTIRRRFRRRKPPKRDQLPIDAVMRPRTRADCVDGPRPCPWFSCRHNLVSDIITGTGSVIFLDGSGGRLPALRRGKLSRQHSSAEATDAQVLRAWEMASETCVLDVAERGMHTNAEIAELLGVSEEEVQRRASSGQRRLKRGIQKAGLDLVWLGEGE